MMRATAEAVGEAAAREGLARPVILGVTVLTSLDQGALAEVGIECPVEEEVVRLARLCEASGLDGVVASPQEIAAVRGALGGPGFVVLTPGIRPRGAARDDQSRVMTPAEAVRAGADYLVVGRPVTAAPDMAAAAEKILEEIELAAAGDV